MAQDATVTELLQAARCGDEAAFRALRRVFVDAARRGSPPPHRAIPGAEPTLADATARISADVLALDAALRELEAISPRQAQVAECRFFAGLSAADTARALDIPSHTVRRDWRVARAWLARAVDAEGGSGG